MRLGHSDAANTALVLLGALAGAYMLMNPPWASFSWARGIRNNNPLNIRATGDQWQGQTSVDDGFVVFQSPEWGVRAAARILRSYAARGVVSLRQIIETWAPPIENDVDSYVSHVSAVTGIGESQPVEPAQYTRLLAAMIHHENGSQPYSAALIAEGVRMAGVTV